MDDSIFALYDKRLITRLITRLTALLAAANRAAMAARVRSVIGWVIRPALAKGIMVSQTSSMPRVHHQASSSNRPIT